VLLELDARRRALAEEARALSDQAQMAERAAASRRGEGRRDRGGIRRGCTAPAHSAAPTAGTLKSLLGAAGRLERALEALDQAVEIVEAPLTRPR